MSTANRCIVQNWNILAEDLVHFEHVDFVDSKHRTELIVAHDFAFVRRVLQAVVLDVYPQLFDHLWARQLVDFQ
jgi:hypothetical protein